MAKSEASLDSQALPPLDSLISKDVLDSARNLLQQCPFPVPDERKQQWLERVARQDPNRLLWHIQRLWHFSGTKVGPLIAEREGTSDPFNRCAREVIGEMLMVYPPSPPTPQMQRGIEMEPLILQKILGGEWLREHGMDPARVRIEKVDAPSSMIWEHNGVSYSGNPDIIVRLRFNDGRAPMVVVMDAKAPASAKDTPYDAYGLQVDHYRWGCRLKGLETTHSAIAQMDYGNWRLQVDFIDPSAFTDNVHRIQQACEYYHREYLVAGNLPDWPERAVYEIPEGDMRQRVEEAAKGYLVTKVLIDNLYRKADAYKESLQEMLEGEPLPKKLDLLPSGLLMASTSRKIDEESAASWYRKLTGQEVPKRVVQKEEPDWDLVTSVLVSNGVPPEQYESPVSRFLLPTGRSPLAKEVADLKSQCGLRLNSVLDAVWQEVQEMDQRYVRQKSPEEAKPSSGSDSPSP